MAAFDRLPVNLKAHIFDHIDDLKTLESFAAISRSQYDTFWASLPSHYERLNDKTSSNIKRLVVIARLAIQNPPGFPELPNRLRSITWSIGPYWQNLLQAANIGLDADTTRRYHPDALILRERYLRGLRLASICRVLVKVAPDEDWLSLETNYSRQSDEIGRRKRVIMEKWEIHMNSDSYIDHWNLTMVYYAYFNAMQDLDGFKRIDGLPFRLFLSRVMYALVTDTKGYKERKTEHVSDLLTLATEWRDALERAVLEDRGALRSLNSPFWLLWWRPQW